VNQSQPQSFQQNNNVNQLEVNQIQERQLHHVKEQQQQDLMRDRELKVIDKVMETLNSVVCQLDNMNNTMKLLEQRIDNFEVYNKNK